jgi:putative NADH-flavin reductase
MIMKVLLVGASGNIGRAIGTELLARGHEVTGVTRSGKAVDGLDIPVAAGDVTDAATLADLAVGKDAVISAVGPRHDGSDPTSPYLAAAAALTEALRKVDVRRLLVVGGAGSLEIAPGARLVDSPDFPAAWKADALRQADALEAYQAVEDLDWTYVSPAALIGPGERTGAYRLGGDQLVVDADGNSEISYADYAAVVVDELEQGNAVRRRITAAY